MAVRVLFFKARRRDARGTSDLFASAGTHPEVKVRKDGVTQRYNVANAAPETPRHAQAEDPHLTALLKQYAGDKDVSPAELAEAARQYREVESRYRGTPGWLKAPNGEPTKLNERQWVLVRTPNFKLWFGDWERAEHRRFLEGRAVAELRGDEFVPDGVPLTVKVPQWYRDHGVATVRVKGLGDVTLDERAVKDSLAHGIGRGKAAAFAAVPDVLRLGRIVASEPSAADPKMTATFIAAPLRMGGTDYVAVVLVRADLHARRMYVHEVVLREKLQASAFKTGALSATSGAPTGAAPGAIRSVVETVFVVNPEMVSKVVDANGEPLVVYRAQDKDRGPILSGSKEKSGMRIYFTDSPAGAAQYAAFRGGQEPHTLSAFLRIVRPMPNDDVMTHAEYALGRHDGMIHPSTFGGSETYFAVDAPSQIKSAIGNIGTFRPDLDHLNKAMPTSAMAPAPPTHEGKHPAYMDAIRAKLADLAVLRRQAAGTDKAIGQAAEQRLDAVNKELDSLRPQVYTDETAAKRYQDLILERGRLHRLVS